MNVEVKVIDTSKGKGLFSKKKICSGSIILEEDPLVSCQFSWNAAYKYKACDHCLRPLETAQENASRLAGYEVSLPYPECCTSDKTTIVSCTSCGQDYCSEECRTEALNQYHQTLCLQTVERNNVHPLERLNEAWKQCHYPPETNSIMLIVRLMARILQAPNREIATQQALQFCHQAVNDDKDLTHKLLEEKFAKDLSCLYELFVAAVPHDGIEQFLTPEGFQSLLALIGTNAQGIGTSPISQWTKNVSELSLSQQDKQALDQFIDSLYDQLEEQSGSFLDNEGVALYSLQSACNHSCAPNAQPQFIHNNHRLSLTALRDIEEGEEIFISYLDDCMLDRSRHSRRKELMKNYLFLCSCPKCEEQAQDPDITSEDDDDNEDEDMSD